MLRDIRESPFAWQHRRALDILATEYDGQSRITAIGIYTVLTWLASESHTPDQLTAYLERVAERCGVSSVTVRRYLHRFQELGLLRIEQHFINYKVHDRNTYYLTTPPEGGTLAGDSTPLAGESTPPLAGESGTLAGERVPIENKGYEEGEQQQDAEVLLFKAEIIEALEDEGVAPKTARELSERDPDLAADWLEAKREWQGARDPAGLLVAKIRAGEQPPRPRKLRWNR